MLNTKECIYCGKIKSESDFSNEHIWPDALGGDFLPDFWKTNDVCRSCNNMSGVFIDGAFIKSFQIASERTYDSLSYLPHDKATGILPLSYIGTIQNVKSETGEIIDYWVCAPGANVLHVRTESEKIWATYTGGDPRSKSKRSKAGRVIVSLTSKQDYWILTALRSVLKHFPKAKHFVTNIKIPNTPYYYLDPNKLEHSNDLQIVEEFESLVNAENEVHAKITIPLDIDQRFLAKVALGIGYKLFGSNFLKTTYATELRKAFREADSNKRNQLKVEHSNYFSSMSVYKKEKLHWPSGWCLSIYHKNNKLELRVITPTRKSIAVQITDEPTLLNSLEPIYQKGVCWITVPIAQTATGPIPYPEYLCHMNGDHAVDALTTLEELKNDPSLLPSH